MSPIVRLSGTPSGTGTFRIGSRTRAGTRYRVEVTPERVTCSCPGYAYRNGCWHVAAVAELLRAEARTQRAAARDRGERRLEEIAQEFGL